MVELKQKKLGLISLTSCGGCLLELTRSKALLLKLGKFYEIIDLKNGKDLELIRLDLVIIEGHPDSKTETEILKQVRRKSEIVVAIGSCAQTGGIDSLRDKLPKKILDREKIISVPSVIRVEYIIPGCPVSKEELTRAIMDIYWGKSFRLPDLSVCFECRQNKNECLLKDKKLCLGPITRAGCNSICINNNEGCLGCRGLRPGANIKKMDEVLAGQKLPTIKEINIFGTDESIN